MSKHFRRSCCDVTKRILKQAPHNDVCLNEGQKLTSNVGKTSQSEHIKKEHNRTAVCHACLHLQRTPTKPQTATSAGARVKACALWTLSTRPSKPAGGVAVRRHRCVCSPLTVGPEEATNHGALTTQNIEKPSNSHSLQCCRVQKPHFPLAKVLKTCSPAGPRAPLPGSASCLARTVKTRATTASPSSAICGRTGEKAVVHESSEDGAASGAVLHFLPWNSETVVGGVASETPRIRAHRKP